MASRVWNWYSNLSYLKRRKFNIIALGKRSVCSNISNGSSSEDDKKSVNQKDKGENAKKIQIDENKRKNAQDKLFSLLSDLQVNNGIDQKHTAQPLNLTKPPQRINKPKKDKEDTQTEDDSTIQGKLKSAVKNIVTHVSTPEDAKEIETELMESISKVTAEPTLGSQLEESSSDEESHALMEGDVEENITSSIKAVASTVFKDNEEEIQSELTKKLIALAFQRESGFKAVEQGKIMDIFQGMKIEAETPQQDTTPQYKISERSFQQHDFERQKRIEKTSARFQSLPVYDVFGSKPLNLFDEPQQTKEVTNLFLWPKLKEKELILSVQFTPTNAFEEMIQLTEEGKHWKFPIDNEIEMGEEENVSFHEHIFLDHLLEGFPKKGPVRNFMELIINGLSKNPHITVERKKENVEWFRNYFEEKKDILQDYQ